MRSSCTTSVTLVFDSLGEGAGVFEECRYDALGRRAFVRSRRPSTCLYPCEAYVQRTIRDGNHPLYEIRSSGGDGVAATIMEGEGVCDGPSTDAAADLFGVVTYATLPGSDDPVGGVDKRYANTNTWDALVPFADYRGQYMYGTHFLEN